MNIDEKIENLLTAIETGLSNSQTSKYWPANPPQMDSYWSDLFANLLIEKIDISTSKWPNIEVLKSQLSNHLLIGLKILKIKKIINNDFVYNFLEKYFKIMEKKTKDDIFCLSGTNRILSEKEINKRLKNLNIRKVEEKDKKEIGYIHSLFSACVWSTVFDAYSQQGMIIHGPYNTEIEGEKLLLLIREFYDFKEKIWKIEEIPKIITYSFYKDVNIKIDFLNHVISSFPLSEKLTYFASIPELEEIKNIEERIENFVLQQRKRVESLSFEEIIIKSLEINCSSFPKLISEEEKEKIIEKTKMNIKKYKDKYWKKFEKVSQEKGRIRKIFDPRISSF